MVRIAGVTIPDEKQIRIALTYIYGIGRALSAKILVSAKIDPFKRTAELNATEVAALRDIIKKTKKRGGDWGREIMMNIKRLKDIAAYRGTRHMRGLPVRGQRTKTNSRTRRGNVRKTMGSGKRSVEKK